MWSSSYATTPGISNDKASRTVEEVPRSGESSNYVEAGSAGGLAVDQTPNHQILTDDLIQGVSQIDLIRS